MRYIHPTLEFLFATVWAYGSSLAISPAMTGFVTAIRIVFYAVPSGK